MGSGVVFWGSKIPIFTPAFIVRFGYDGHFTYSTSFSLSQKTFPEDGLRKVSPVLIRLRYLLPLWRGLLGSWRPRSFSRI